MGTGFRFRARCFLAFTTAVLFLIPCTAAAAGDSRAVVSGKEPQDYDFYYSYKNPSASDADDYIVSVSNAVVYSEGSVRAWKQDVGSLTFEDATPGVIIYRFDFEEAIGSVDLFIRTTTFHWNYSKGHTFIHGSRDGLNWVQLAEAVPPEFEKWNLQAAQSVPESLLGGTSLWFKVELYSYGSSASNGGVWTNTAQHSRYDTGADNTTFVLGVNFAAALAGPELESPVNGEGNVALDAVLSGRPYAGFPAGAYHVTTEWVVADNTDFNRPVLQRETLTGSTLVQYGFPPFVLQPLTTYYWKARYIDSSGKVSDWSDTWSFTTEADANDRNGNGIRDDQEVASPIVAGDKVFSTVSGGGQIGVAVPGGGATVRAVESIDPDDISSTGRPFSMPLDLVAARFTVPAEGAAVVARIYFSQAAPQNASWLVYDPASGWQAFSGARFSDNGMYVDLDLTDGGDGDADGVANGVIVDPGGFGLASWIQGTVTDARTAQPLRHATVAIADLSLTTARDGNYLSIVLPGTYSARVSADGYGELSTSGIVVPEGGVLDRDFALSSVPAPGLRINGRQGSVPVGQGVALIELSMVAGGDAGTGADWWVVADTPSGLYYLQIDSSIRWSPWPLASLPTTYRGALADLPWIDVGQYPGLPTAGGTYTFYFAVDLTENGAIDIPTLHLTATAMTR